MEMDLRGVEYELKFEHIRKLNNFLDKNLNEWIYKETKAAYLSLSRLLVAKLIVFCRMKAGEASRISDFDFLFSDTVQKKRLPKHITQNADGLTRAMQDRMFKLIFTTKYERVSFVVLPSAVVDRMRDIVRLRDPLNLSLYDFLFVHPDDPRTPLKGNYALQEAAKSALPDFPTCFVTAHHIREHYRVFTRDVTLEEWRRSPKLYDTETDDD